MKIAMSLAIPQQQRQNDELFLSHFNKNAIKSCTEIVNPGFWRRRSYLTMFISDTVIWIIFYTKEVKELVKINLKWNYVVNGISNKNTATGKTLQSLQLEMLSIDYNRLPHYAIERNLITWSKLINSKIIVRNKFNKTKAIVIESWRTDWVLAACFYC